VSKQEHKLHKNQNILLRIDSIAPGGQGFARYEGVSVFVDGGVPGDLVELELYDVRSSFAHGKIVKLLEPSALRGQPPCKLADICGGCQWQHVAYEAQLALKTDIVRQSLKHTGGLDPDIVENTLASPDILHYRNKVQYPVSSPQKSSRILAGYYREASHELINIKHCPVQPQLLDATMEAAKLAAEKAGLSAYDEKKHHGLLRHINARYSFHNNEVLLTCVLNAAPDSFERLKGQLLQFAGEVMAQVPAVVGVCVNFNSERSNRIMGRETRLVSGRAFIIEELASAHKKAPEILRAGLKFQLSPASFFQINCRQAVALMDLVLDAVIALQESKGLDRLPLILDAFAGVGSIALWVAALADRVLAIEEAEEAVRDATEILKLNNIANVEPLCGRVEEVFPQLVGQGIKPEIIILDPPRKGVDPAALTCAVQLAPEQIIYVSCNPSTLARDLKILTASGYRLKSARPLDLFPQTFHVETVCVLGRT
jgi:23S rRNA (uracil1939-C5)-methyltransferase